MSYGKKPDIEKRRLWQRIVREAARSGLSIREFCRQRWIKESRFYWWQRRLQEERSLGRRRPPQVPDSETARFALVSDEPGALVAGLELVLANGRRLRISQGVDEATLRTVLASLEAESC
jgi:transposase-like protein